MPLQNIWLLIPAAAVRNSLEQAHLVFFENFGSVPLVENHVVSKELYFRQFVRHNVSCLVSSLIFKFLICLCTVVNMI